MNIQRILGHQLIFNNKGKILVTPKPGAKIYNVVVMNRLGIPKKIVNIDNPSMSATIKRELPSKESRREIAVVLNRRGDLRNAGNPERIINIGINSNPVRTIQNAMLKLGQ